MLAIVQAGFGCALVPESCCRGTDNNLIVREIESELPSVDIAAVWAQDNTNEALQKFIRFLPGPEL
jgi:DNA-binding transcriptional LysR family regulator